MAEKQCVDDCCVGHVGPVHNGCYDCVPDPGNSYCPTFYALKDRVVPGTLYDTFAAIIRGKIQYCEDRKKK